MRGGGPGGHQRGRVQPKVVTKNVSVGDDFFKPTKLTINKKSAINFVWKKANFDSHNVTLVKGRRV